MASKPGRLTREDWIEAALAALRRDGPDAVAVQPLAREIGATKGSFYWHFETAEHLLVAALERWEELGTEDVIAHIEGLPGPATARLTALFELVFAHAQAHPGDVRLLGATDRPAVAAAVERVTARRIGFVARLLEATGVPAREARSRATVAYAAYLGLAQLALTAPPSLPATARARRQLAGQVAELFGGPAPS
jgi:AcrR family transcriptional regulator